MIGKNDILKIAKHIIKRGQNIPDRKLIHPEREWALGIVMFVAVLLTGSTLSVGHFSYYKNIDEKLPPQNLSLVKYQSGTMHQVLEKKRGKSDRFAQIAEGAVDFFPVVESSDSDDSSEVEDEVETEGAGGVIVE